MCEPATLTAIAASAASLFSGGAAVAGTTAAVAGAGAAAAGGAAAASTIFGLTAAQLALVSAGVTAVGGITAGISAKRNGDAQAIMAGRNAERAGIAANDAVTRGNEDLKNHFAKVGQLRGQQRAVLASNGVDVEFGSAADLQDDTLLQARADAATISENAQREADSYRMSQGNYRADASISKSMGRAALASSALEAAGTLLGGAQQYQTATAKYGKARTTF